MCELLDRYIKVGEEKGLKEGLEEGLEKGERLGAISAYRRMNTSESKIVEELITVFHLSEDEAKAYLKDK